VEENITPDETCHFWEGEVKFPKVFRIVSKFKTHHCKRTDSWFLLLLLFTEKHSKGVTKNFTENFNFTKFIELTFNDN
jgi:hypothetical protein